VRWCKGGTRASLGSELRRPFHSVLSVNPLSYGSYHVCRPSPCVFCPIHVTLRLRRHSTCQRVCQPLKGLNLARHATPPPPQASSLHPLPLTRPLPCPHHTSNCSPPTLVPTRLTLTLSQSRHRVRCIPNRHASRSLTADTHRLPTTPRPK